MSQAIRTQRAPTTPKHDDPPRIDLIDRLQFSDSALLVLIRSIGRYDPTDREIEAGFRSMPQRQRKAVKKIFLTHSKLLRDLTQFG